MAERVMVRVVVVVSARAITVLIMQWLVILVADMHGYVLGFVVVCSSQTRSWNFSATSTGSAVRPTKQYV